MKIKKLKKGDKVAIVSLSSGILGEDFVKHELDLGVKRLKELGLEPVFMKNSLLGIETLKNDPKLRAEDLKQAFADNEIKAIISAIGGNDAYKLIPYLLDDNKFIESVKMHPKIFTGYSDTTTIHLVLNSLGLSTFYGPALITDFAEFENEMLPYTKKSIEYFFNAPENYQILPSEFWYKERSDFSPSAVGTEREKFKEKRGFEVLQGKGKSTGKLFGGCLEIIHSIIEAEQGKEKFNQSKHTYDGDSVEIFEKFHIFPKPNELSDTILFLETSDNKPTPEEFRKMIQVLKENKIFDYVNGVLFGKPIDEAYYNEYKQILTEELKVYDFTVMINLNFGHSFPRMVLPYGVQAEIDADTKKLTLLSTTLD